jgi:hypothetical protein
VFTADEEAPTSDDLRKILNYARMADHAFRRAGEGRSVSVAPVRSSADPGCDHRAERQGRPVEGGVGAEAGLNTPTPPLMGSAREAADDRTTSKPGPSSPRFDRQVTAPARSFLLAVTAWHRMNTLACRRHRHPLEVGVRRQRLAQCQPHLVG